MYAREVPQNQTDDSVYEDVDARTIEWLRAEMDKRAKSKKMGKAAHTAPSGLHPELIR